MLKGFTNINKMEPLKGAEYQWLETNGRGGFCCGTISDCPSSKYHGLLVTPLSGKEGRYHILSAVEASVLGDNSFTLATNFYKGVVHPEGYKYIKDFSVFPLPSWNYKKSETNIKKEVFMAQGEKAVYIVFTQVSHSRKIKLDLKFLFTCREADSETHANEEINTTSKMNKDGFEISPYIGLPPVTLSFSGRWHNSHEWFWDYNVEYPKERERGLSFFEDRFVPGIVTIELEENVPFVVRVSTEELLKSKADIFNTYKQIIKRRKVKTSKLKNNTDVLSYFANNFLVENSHAKKSINAGFPWFGEWGRDTMIALPGLSFCNGKTSWAVDVFRDYASLIKDGLLPNTLGESQGFTSYNSLDAGLLYCRAVLKLVENGFGKNKAEVVFITKTLLPAVKSIVNAFIEERVPYARLTDEKLIESGNPLTQLTWMDATAYGKPVTPRYGLAVDINALWFDSLSVLEKLYMISNKKMPENITQIKSKVAENFRKVFWLKDLNFLTDTVVDGCQDRKLRPNMLFASSAQDGLLTKQERASVVQIAKQKLLTPLGVRTLSPDDPNFEPFYFGNSNERDSKYHQGTVWPWLLGIMIESSLLSSDNLEKEVKFWSEYTDNFLKMHLFNDGIGFISEIFDGLNPFCGKGCFAQAWSTAEIIRACSLIKDKSRTKRKINDEKKM